MTEVLKRLDQLGPDRHQATREIDTAVGILVGWRRSSTHAAFQELVSVGERHGVPIFALAEALVSLASRDADNQTTDTAAQLAAAREWGVNYLL